MVRLGRTPVKLRWAGRRARRVPQQRPDIGDPAERRFLRHEFHYESNIMVIEKYEPSKIWTAVLYDADQKYYYIKRFLLEVNTRKQNFLGENPKNRLMLLTDEVYPRIEVIFGGHDAFREALVLDADEFIAVKGFKAKGKRISTFEVETINELEPNRFVPSENASESDDTEGNEEGNDTDDGQSTTDIIDEITGQMKLFDE